MTAQKNKQASILELADAIESEMIKLGLWNSLWPPTASPHKAFGADSMSFEEWLQVIFLPALRRAAATGTYPSQSSVSVAAIRNLDGVEGVEHLIDLLSRVDRAVEQS